MDNAFDDAEVAREESPSQGMICGVIFLPKLIVNYSVVHSHAGLSKVVKRGRSVRKVAEGGEQCITLDNGGPSLGLVNGGAFIRALLGGENLDWMGWN